MEEYGEAVLLFAISLTQCMRARSALCAYARSLLTSALLSSQNTAVLIVILSPFGLVSAMCSLKRRNSFVPYWKCFLSEENTCVSVPAFPSVYRSSLACFIPVGRSVLYERVHLLFTPKHLQELIGVHCQHPGRSCKS